MPAAHPGEFGIEQGYRDGLGRWRVTPDTTRAAIRASIGTPRDDEDPAAPPVQVVGPEDFIDLGDAEAVVLEDGTELGVIEGPSRVPPGYHQLVGPGGETRRLIVSPGRCYLPDELRAWGWAVQLYSVRSRRTWGMGDLGTLAELGSWASASGAGALLLNPLHAHRPGLPQEASPYLPSSRRFRDPLYLEVTSVPGSHVLPGELIAEATALNADELIDRDRIYTLKMDALEEIWSSAGPPVELEAFRRRGGDLLTDFATYMSIAERHPGDPQKWPSELQHPRGPGVARWRDAHAERVAFHSWVQYLLEVQLHRAQERTDLIHDLAVGVDPAGADRWLWQDVFAPGMSVGAPPDAFNTRGQNWGVPPFDPRRLRAAGYGPFIETIRAQLQHAAGLRIDHVMGLFRLYWIPEAASAAEGAYVRYPHRDLLNIVALESQRARSYVIGEDLGTVENIVRDEMTARHMLGYRLLWFEEGPPESYPRDVLAAISSHDLPTIAGMWDRSDLAEQGRLGLEPDAASVDAIRTRLAALTGATDDTDVGSVIEAAHEALARSRARLLVATLEDALGAERRPNQPGTGPERPNWRIPLPAPLEELLRSPLAARIAAALDRR